MKTYNTVSFWLFILVTLSVTLAARHSRLIAHISTDELFDQTPGEVYVGGDNCSGWNYIVDDEIDCVTERGWIRYNQYTGMITHVSTYIYSRPLTVGELATDWGTPTGYYRSSGIDIVCWNNIYVYAIGHPFSPASQIVVILWDLKKTCPTWRGFYTYIPAQ